MISHSGNHNKTNRIHHQLTRIKHNKKFKKISTKAWYTIQLLVFTSYKIEETSRLFKKKASAFVHMHFFQKKISMTQPILRPSFACQNSDQSTNSKSLNSSKINLPCKLKLLKVQILKVERVFLRWATCQQAAINMHDWKLVKMHSLTLLTIAHKRRL